MNKVATPMKLIFWVQIFWTSWALSYCTSKSI